MTQKFHPHHGGPMPVQAHTLVDIRLRDGHEAKAVPAGLLDWHHFGPDYDDIVGWRFARAVPGPLKRLAQRLTQLLSQRKPK
jgi:hypothetical protein